MREKPIQGQVFLKLGSRPDIRLWRNNVGNGFFGKVVDTEKTGTGLLVVLESARRVQTGLCVGSSDIIGIRRVKITPEMVGKEIGQFLAIECKSTTGRTSKEQRAFLDTIRRFGGVAVEAKGEIPEIP